MTQTRAEMFRPLVLPHRGVPKSALPKYRVYSDANNFVTLEAENAQVALAQSGIKDPLRIEQDNILLQNIIIFSVAETPANTQELAAPPMPTVEEAPVEKTETASPLSNDEVNELLKS